MFPLGVAVARSFPTYTQKSVKSAERNVTVSKGSPGASSRPDI